MKSDFPKFGGATLILDIEVTFAGTWCRRQILIVLVHECHHAGRTAYEVVTKSLAICSKFILRSDHFLRSFLICNFDLAYLVLMYKCIACLPACLLACLLLGCLLNSLQKRLVARTTTTTLFRLHANLACRERILYLGGEICYFLSILLY